MFGKEKEVTKGGEAERQLYEKAVKHLIVILEVCIRLDILNFSEFLLYTVSNFAWNTDSVGFRCPKYM